MKKAILWAILVVGMVSVGAAQDDYQEWHQERIEKLTRPDGYLSLVGLSWLKETPVEVEGIGTAWVDGTKVYVDLEPRQGDEHALALSGYEEVASACLHGERGKDL